MSKRTNGTILIPGDKNDWLKSYRFANMLLNARKDVLWAQTQIRAKTDTGIKSFPAGSFVIQLQSDAIISPSQLIEEAEALKINWVSIKSEVEGELSYLRAPMVALYSDGGSPYPFADILSSIGINYDSVTALDVRNGELNKYDVFIIPGGGFEGPPIQGALLGDEGRRAIKEFLHRGGGLWGSCAGCCNLVHMSDETLKSWESLFKNWPPMKSLEVINAEYWSVGMSGVGKLKVKNVNPYNPIMFGLPREFEMTWHLGPFLSPINSRTPEASLPIPLVQLDGFTNEWTSAEYIYAQSKQSEPNALDNTYAGRGIKEKRFGIIAGYYGHGKVCASGGHPEFGLDWLLEKWGEPARMIANFVFWTVSYSSPSYKLLSSRPKSSTTVSDLFAHKMLAERCSNLKRLINKLIVMSRSKKPGWLSEDKAGASFGISGQEKWGGILKRLSELPDEVVSASMALLHSVSKLRGLLNKLEELKNEPNDEMNLDTLNQIEADIKMQLALTKDDYIYSRPSEWKQDYGWSGVLLLLDSAKRAIDYSIRNFDNPNVTREDSPYYAIWGWYLGGLYDLINALIVLRGRERILRDRIQIWGFALDKISKGTTQKVRAYQANTS